MAGVCVALVAARHGAATILAQDGSILGGNDSGQIRID